MTEYKYDYFKTNEEADEFRRFEKNYFREKIDILEVKNGIVLPVKKINKDDPWMGRGGVLDEDGRFVELSGIRGFERTENEFVFGGKYDISDGEIVESNEEVIYMGAYWPHWGHFLLEYITRLWYCLKSSSESKIVFCGFSGGENGISDNFLELIELLGIKGNRLISVKQPTRYKKIIVPEQSFHRYHYYTNEYKEMVDIIREKVNQKVSLEKYKNIYFTRELFAGKKERGEKRVRRLFEDNGFKVLSPEKLSALEQIYYVSNCQRLAVPIGGASMNAVFAKHGCELIMIKKCSEIDGDMHVVAGVCQASKVSFVDCYYRLFKTFPVTSGAGPHLYRQTEELDKYLKDSNMTVKYKRNNIEVVGDWFWLFLKYIKYTLVKSKIYKIVKTLKGRA